MQPEIVSDKAGNCPICKMKLEPVANESLPQIISPNQQVLSSQATVKLQAGNNGNTLKAEGFIVPAQNRNQSVAARFGGRIEKLHVKFSNQYVKQGDKIMDLYSPSLRTIQEEHLFLFNSTTENSLLEKSREKTSLVRHFRKSNYSVGKKRNSDFDCFSFQPCKRLCVFQYTVSTGKYNSKKHITNERHEYVAKHK